MLVFRLLLLGGPLSWGLGPHCDPAHPVLTVGKWRPSAPPEHLKSLDLMRNARWLSPAGGARHDVRAPELWELATFFSHHTKGGYSETALVSNLGAEGRK